METPSPLLEGEAFHYVTRVLRKARGDRLILFGRSNLERVCVIREVATQSLRLEVLETRAIDTESRIDLTLAIATGKRKKLEEVVEAATALGVRRIVPFSGFRSVSKRGNPRLMERLAAIAESACRQSGRTATPDISAVQPDLASALEETRTEEGVRWCLDEAGGMEPAQGVSGWERGKPVVLFCGPEGGWSDEERNLFREEGALAVWLGPRILRTELAAVFGVGLFERLLSDRLESPDGEKGSAS